MRRRSTVVRDAGGEKLGARDARVLRKWRDSGDVSGDKECGGRLPGGPLSGVSLKAGPVGTRRTLLVAARRTIASAIIGGATRLVTSCLRSQRIAGAFVSLHIGKSASWMRRVSRSGSAAGRGDRTLLRRVGDPPIPDSRQSAPRR